MKTDFIKVNDLIINRNHIDAIYSNKGRGTDGFTLIIGGQRIQLSDAEAKVIENHIWFNGDYSTEEEFDLDRRIK